MTRFACVLAAALPAAALAAEPKVEVKLDTVLASEQGNEVSSPELEKMKREFAKQSFKFTSFKQLSSERIELTRTARAISLPNGSSPKLRLIDVKDGRASISVELRPGVRSRIALGKAGDVYLQGGAYRDGQLVLVLSPVGGKPRRSWAHAHMLRSTAHSSHSITSYPVLFSR